jgi:alkyl hydroperoxide reductase subunit AhpC
VIACFLPELYFIYRAEEFLKIGCEVIACSLPELYLFYRAEEFRKIGCEVIACSTDSHFSHLAWCERPRKQGGLGDMDIPLLADKSMAISRAYGVLKVSGHQQGMRSVEGKWSLAGSTEC